MSSLVDGERGGEGKRLGAAGMVACKGLCRDDTKKTEDRRGGRRSGSARERQTIEEESGRGVGKEGLTFVGVSSMVLLEGGSFGEGLAANRYGDKRGNRFPGQTESS
jgi:hypothetical protein